VMEFILAEQADKVADKKGVTDKLGDVLPPMLDAKLPRLRGAALYLLAAGQRSKLYDRALQAVDDPSPIVRPYAFRALGRLRVEDEADVEKCVARLEDEDPSSVAAPSPP